MAVLSVLNSRWGWVFNSTHLPLCPRVRDPVSVLKEAGWAPEPVWVDEKTWSPSDFGSRAVHPVASLIPD